MNIAKPILLIIIGSLSTSLGLLLLILFLQLSTNLSVEPVHYFLLGLGTFSISGVIYFVLIKRYINRRIKLIYRIIGNKKMANTTETEVAMAEDVIGSLQKETARWAAEKTAQISVLQEDANFRKEFLGNLSHELKTPVFSIQGFLLTLLEGGLEDENVNRQFCERALKGVDRISALLKDLDTISQFEINKIELKKTKFDIVETTSEVMDILSSKADEKSIALKFYKKYDPIFVHADQNKITQVLTNLISNSISYGKNEGETAIRIHHLESEQVLVEVADNGLGMEEKHLDRLFERFYRVDKSRERNTGGSGLGLAIVKHIIEAHGQSINVRSTLDVGSTFSFTLDKG